MRVLLLAPPANRLGTSKGVDTDGGRRAKVSADARYSDFSDFGGLEAVLQVRRIRLKI